MQTTSELWKSIFSKEHWAETAVEIGGTTYGISNFQLNEIETDNKLFSGKNISVGWCAAREVDFVFKGSLRSLPSASEVKIKTRLVGADGRVSEWIPKGTFYIDTRPYDPVQDTTVVHGYDAMLKMQQPMIAAGTPSGTWPKTPTELMTLIANRIGVELDPRTTLNNSYQCEFPPSVTGDDETPSTTMRQMAGWVAAMHCGNWVITDSGKLHLVTLKSIGSKGYPLLLADVGKRLVVGNSHIIIKLRSSSNEASEYDSSDIGKSAVSMTVDKKLQYFSDVEYYYGEETLAHAGDGTGRTLEIECPWATQAMANAAQAMLYKRAYQPFTADGAILDPATELGDGIIIAGYESVIATMDTHFGSLYTADISAPSDEEIDHEYPYEAPISDAVMREISKSHASITVDMDEIRLSVEDEAAARHSEIVQNINSIRLNVVNDADGKHATIQLWVPGADEPFSTAKILLEGNVNVDGTLSAQALYTAFGDVANLLVDKLSTSRRIPRYLAQNKDDDNYIKIQNERIQYISAVCTGETEQAANPDGVLIYWEADPSTGTIGVNGYPYIDNVPIYTTTEETPWPVTVYTYTELVKSEYKFEQNERGDYVPVMVFGAGDENGNDKLTIRKAVSKAELLYKASTGADIGMVMNLDGYTDIYGLRRCESIDFSMWDGGYVEEQLEGGITCGYNIEFDSGLNPIRIYDDDHSMSIVWGEEAEEEAEDGG